MGIRLIPFLIPFLLNKCDEQIEKRFQNNN